MFSFESYRGKKSLGVLLDPDKTQLKAQDVTWLKTHNPDFILVGGSQSFSYDRLDNVVSSIKHHTDIPVVLFPGSKEQIHPKADALLGLSIIQAEDNNYIFKPLIEVLKRDDLEKMKIYYTPYILTNLHEDSSVLQAIDSNLEPLDTKSKWIAYFNMLKLMNIDVIYIEAGSGSNEPVSTEIISDARNILSDTYIIVGGGITNTDQLNRIWSSGADCSIIGNFLETHKEGLSLFCNYRNQCQGI